MKMVTMLKTLRPVSILLGTTLVLLAAACGNAQPDGRSAGARSGQLSIVTAFYPLQFVAERVGGQHGQVASLTQPGAEPHDLELTPRQVASVAEADLVIYERTFQAAVDEAVDQSGNPRILDVTTAVPLQQLGAGYEDEADHDGEHADDEAGPVDSGLDPHVWLDPQKMIIIANAVRDQLVSVDPANATDYTANAATLEAELSALDQAFVTGLAHCARSEFVTQHTAFGYLAQRYGLTQIGISGLSPDSEPSPARVAAVQEEAKKHGVTTIFYETLVSPAVAKSIAGDLGLKTDVLDPIEGITPESRGSDYVAVMTANLTALQAANACGP
jgi:zinc transport system substrate-binding protein